MQLLNLLKNSRIYSSKQHNPWPRSTLADDSGVKVTFFSCQPCHNALKCFMRGSRGGGGGRETGTPDPLANNKVIGLLKGIYHCPIEIIKGLTDKGQFQYLTKLKGPQVGNYLYTTQFLSLR